MFIRINSSNGVPIYRQIVDQVRVAVATGALTLGERLPSVRNLSETLTINPTTVQRAYLELEREGLIETRRGQGTFVLAETPTLPPPVRDERVRSGLRDAFATAHQLGLDVSRVRTLAREELERIYRDAQENDR